MSFYIINDCTFYATYELMKMFFSYPVNFLSGATSFARDEPSVNRVWASTALFITNLLDLHFRPIPLEVLATQ